MLPPNTVLQNRYRIVRQLGRGGMGAVYEAVDQRLSSIVAIKETLVTSDDAPRAFEREASLLANLRHRSLPNVTDHFAEGEGQFLVMQFIPGEDLSELLERRQGAFPAPDVVRWADEILKALEYLHSHNPPILHRDIKPANIKMTQEGELFLIDFGLSKGAAGQMATLLTSRSVKGYTAAYAPLEQIHGGGTDPRSDLYSVGATLYHLLTYIPPVDAPTRFNALDDLQPDPMLPADQINSHVPQALAQVLTQAMAMNRRNRPADAAAMRRMLQEALPRLAEDAVPMRKESIPIAKPAPSPPTLVLPPTEPATETIPLPPTRSTDSLDLGTASTPAVAAVPTIKEASTLIERPAQIPATLVLPATPPPAGSTRQAVPAPRRRRIGAPLIAAVISVVVLFVLGVGALLAVRWLNNRNAIQNQTTSTPASVNDSQASVTKPADVPTKRFFTGDFSVGKAFELIYGSYDAQKKYAKWKLTAEDIQNSPIAGEASGLGPGTVYTAANFFQSFAQGGIQRYVLITETVPARYDCHACAPIMGGAVFAQVGTNWQLEAENKIISTMGGFGSAPKGKLIQIGPDRHGAVFRPGGMGQGITAESVVVIADAGDSLKEILIVDEYAGDNGGTCGEGMATCYSFTSKLEFVPGNNPDYYDARVTTTGTKEDKDGNIRRANAVRKFTFSGGKYVTAR